MQNLKSNASKIVVCALALVGVGYISSAKRLIRWEKQAHNCLALLHLVPTIIAFEQA